MFDIKNTELLQSIRLDLMVDIYLKTAGNCPLYIRVVPFTFVNKDTWKDKLNYYIKSGYEGIILRHPNKLYECRRPWFILKYKPMKQDIYTIVDIIEAVSKNNKPLGRIGKIICKDRFNNRFSNSAGIGFTHQKSEELFKNKDSLIGKNVILNYQNVTNKGIPRFPRFIEITDKNEIHV